MRAHWRSRKLNWPDCATRLRDCAALASASNPRSTPPSRRWSFDRLVGVIGNAMKRAILWEYPRESWQYNAFVAIILLFIFLTRRSWFRDQPRAQHASQVMRL